jgi:hypothetical protein
MKGMTMTTECTRRTFMLAAPVAAFPATAITGAAEAATTITPEARLERAITEMVAAMTLMHGQECGVYRNEERAIVFFHNRVVAFQGDGVYEIELGKARPVVMVERWPSIDHATDGKGFKITPKAGNPWYTHEHYLKYMLTEKLSGMPIVKWGA